MKLFERLFRQNPVTKIVTYHATCPICANYRRMIDMAVDYKFYMLEALHREALQKHLAEVHHV